MPNISGITKLDDYTVQVVTDGYEAPAVYQIFGIGVAPLHYYGDASKYDYDNNMFGHDFGDPRPPSPWALVPTSSLSTRTV